jgi:hypothetical protein
MLVIISLSLLAVYCSPLNNLMIEILAHQAKEASFFSESVAEADVEAVAHINLKSVLIGTLSLELY